MLLVIPNTLVEPLLSPPPEAMVYIFNQQAKGTRLMSELLTDISK